MANKNLKIIGITVSLTWVSLIVLAIFLKAISVLFDSWFYNHALWIAIISGVILFIFVVTGIISLRAMISGTRGE